MTGPQVRMEPNGPDIVTGPITSADADGNEVRVSRPSFLPEPVEER